MNSDLGPITRVEILDAWAGLSPASPRVAEYQLDRELDCFLGGANFRVGEYPTLARTYPVEVPMIVVDRFVRDLESAPRRRGKYRPKITHTDDYPSIRIVLRSDSMRVVYWTMSQGREHVPWARQDGDGVVIIASPAPARAYEQLWEYLHRDKFDALATKRMRDYRS
jgi:hypothetical protein